jgi:phosphoglycerate dehydrogenase-like enzyme
MQKLKVLITAPLTQGNLQAIAQMDPRLEVVDVIDLVKSDLGLTGKATVPWAPTTAVMSLSPEEASRKLDELLAAAEIILGWRLPHNLLTRAPRLRWVQTIGAGIDIVANQSGLLESSVLFTNASGVHAAAMREHIFWMMLEFARSGCRLRENQRQRRWQRFVPGQLAGKILGIVGLGSIGRVLAQAGRAFDMKVVASKHSAERMMAGTEGVDIIYPRTALCNLLAASDYVVLCVPLTPDTRRLIGEAELKAMKPAAYLINISRGSVVDEATLVKALKEGWIAGAGLDVFEQEPLPADSELWGLPNVIISPHVAGIGEDYSGLVTDLFRENLKRYLAGKELINLVDKGKGY